jgi:ectoine hydroxylase
VLCDHQLDAYRRDGIRTAPVVLTAGSLDLLRREVDRLAGLAPEGTVRERGGTIIRAMHGVHQQSAAFAALAASRPLVGIAERVLGGSVYVHQFKVNIKAPLAGGAWQWHQDYVFWRERDGISRCDLLNVAVFLDDVDDSNGPLSCLRGSNREGVLEQTIALAGPDWTDDVAEELSFSVPDEIAAELAVRYPALQAVGPAGTVVLFHPNLVHGSAPNRSTRPRTMVIITYNRWDNPPAAVAEPRPWYLCERAGSVLEAADHLEWESGDRP